MRSTCRAWRRRRPRAPPRPLARRSAGRKRISRLTWRRSAAWGAVALNGLWSGAVRPGGRRREGRGGDARAKAEARGGVVSCAVRVCRAGWTTIERRARPWSSPGAPRARAPGGRTAACSARTRRRRDRRATPPGGRRRAVRSRARRTARPSSSARPRARARRRLGTGIAAREEHDAAVHRRGTHEGAGERGLEVLGDLERHREVERRPRSRGALRSWATEGLARDLELVQPRRAGRRRRRCRRRPARRNDAQPGAATTADVEHRIRGERDRARWER